MNRQNIAACQPCLSAMVSPLPGTPNCQLQPLGISDQELESLLAKPAKELPVQVFRELGNKLQPMTYGACTGDWIHVAELLGFSREQIENLEVRSNIQREPPGFLMLMEWRTHEESSTLFILRDTLWSCGRHDCVSLLDRKIEDVMFMHLYLRIIDNSHPSSQMRLLKIRTKCDATIRESLQNLLGGDSDDSEYELVDTPLLSKAKRFKGKQITLRKKNRKQPDILPLNIAASESSNSDNSITDFNITTPMCYPQTQDRGLTGRLNETRPDRLDERDVQANLPTTCVGTTRKINYITEDCVHCGNMRTMSQRHVSETSSTIVTDMQCPYCYCSITQPEIAQIDPRISHQREIPPSFQDTSPCHRVHPCSCDTDDSEVTFVKQLHRGAEDLSKSKTKANSYTQLPSAPSLSSGCSALHTHSYPSAQPPSSDRSAPSSSSDRSAPSSSSGRSAPSSSSGRSAPSSSSGRSAPSSSSGRSASPTPSCPSAPPPNSGLSAPLPNSGVQKYPTNYEENTYIPMTQTKRQRSVSEPPDLLVADLENKFDLSMTTSSSCEIPKRSKKRKVTLSYQEICEILRNFPGWDPSEAENTVEQSMSRYCREDGNYVVWYMREAHRLVVTVSHMRKLVHYAVFSERHSNGQDWHYFFADHKFPDIRSLLRYHMENGLDPQATQKGEGRREFDTQHNLRSSRKEAILSHVSLKYPRRSQPAKASSIL